MAFIGEGVEAGIAVAVSLALVLGLDGSRRATPSLLTGRASVRSDPGHPMLPTT